MRVLSYRFATDDDIPAAGRLVAHSFPGPARPASWWEGQIAEPRYGGGAGILLLGTDAGRVVAACQLHPLKQWIAGRALSVTGIGTVAIAPTHRKRRLGADLVTRALRAGRERGDVAASLYPFRTSFYQKLGFGQADVALQYQVPPDSLPDSDERLRVELIEDDIRRIEVMDLYRRWVRTQTGQLERTELVWVDLLGGGDRALVAYRAENGTLEGYALVVYRADLPPQARFLEVDELVWTTGRARAGLYAWLSSLGDQWPQILLRSLPSHGLGDWIREPRLPWGTAPSWRLWAPGATLLYGTMFRLLDMSAWEGRRLEPAGTLTVVLHIVDDQIRENGGEWRLVLDEGRATIEPARTPAAGDVTLRMNISTLSRLFGGGAAPTRAHDARLLECDRPELLPVIDAALRLPEPWTFDRF